MAYYGRGIIDITGNIYNFLKVLGYSHSGPPAPDGSKGGRTYWHCECTRCGKIVVLDKSSFAYSWSRVKSCGCWGKEERTKRMIQRNKDGLNPMVMNDDHKGDNHWMKGGKGKRFPKCPKCGCFVDKEGKCNQCGVM